MLKKHRQYIPQVLILVVLLAVAGQAQPGSILVAQAAEGNLADQAVNYLYGQYQSNGPVDGLDLHYPFVAYVLKLAGVDLRGWQYNNIKLDDAINAAVDADIEDCSTPSKLLAIDLLAMLQQGDAARAGQVQAILQQGQNPDGTFLYDCNVFSVLSAYDYLARAGKLGVFNAVYTKNYILGRQQTSGAFADFMGTAAAVRALVAMDPARSDSAVQDAITKGCQWMKSNHLEDGSFKAGMDDPLIDAVEAVATERALGIDASAWKTSGGYSAVDYLEDKSKVMKRGDGSFGLCGNVMDGIYALDAYIMLGILPQSQSGGVAVTGVGLNKSSDTLAVGDADTLVATVEPANATDQSVCWTSDSEAVATVDQTGKVTAVTAGMANIRATTTDGGFCASCAVTVQAVPVQISFDLNNDNVVNVQDLVLVGQHFGATGTPGWIGEDVNRDGRVNIQDLVLVGQHFNG